MSAIPDNVLARLEEAERLKMTGEHTAALEILEGLVVEDPTNVSALEEIADNELSLDNFERAERAATQAIEIDSESYTGHYILGFVRSHESKWEESLNHLQIANSQRPNNPEILRCLGWSLFNSGKRAQGIVTLERALNLDKDNPLTLCDLGVSYLQVKNIPKAQALFTHALDLDPENIRAKECVEAVNRIAKALAEDVSQEEKEVEGVA